MSKTITKVIAGLGIVAGLGVAALPLSSYAGTQDVTVSFKVAPGIVPGTETICVTPGVTNPALGQVQVNSTATVECRVSYSANGGASVSIVDKDSNNSLVGTNASNTIPALALNANQSAMVPGTAGWGYKFVATTPGAGTGGLTAIAAAANYNGVPTGTALTIGSNTDPVSGAVGTFTFGVQTASTTVADTYSDVVTVAVTPAP